jgi:hypothetical protein
MDYISVLHDSIKTSVTMNIFENINDSSIAHIFNSKLVKINLLLCKNMLNFDSNRLQNTAEEAYPIHNRPRGDDDINSVFFHQNQIKNGQNLEPIWIIVRDNQYILLDGAHRIVASYIENKPILYSYIIYS